MNNTSTLQSTTKLYHSHAELTRSLPRPHCLLTHTDLLRPHCLGMLTDITDLLCIDSCTECDA
jgi:hypothetical protein